MRKRAPAMSPERFPRTRASGHLREPILFMPNLVRGLNATLGASATNLAQPMPTKWVRTCLRAQRVQLFFAAEPDFEGGLLGPEFQIYSTQTAADRAMS
jgi:hypothetical protein